MLYLKDHHGDDGDSDDGYDDDSGDDDDDDDDDNDDDEDNDDDIDSDLVTTALLVSPQGKYFVWDTLYNGEKGETGRSSLKIPNL